MDKTSREEKEIKKFVNKNPGLSYAIKKALELSVDMHGQGPGLCQIAEIPARVMMPYSSDTRGFLWHCFRLWPKFSGVLSFPVPHPNGGHPRDAYKYCRKYEGKYGEDRKELARLIITIIDKYS